MSFDRLRRACFRVRDLTLRRLKLSGDADPIRPESASACNKSVKPSSKLGLTI
jgi:hypothetical protein